MRPTINHTFKIKSQTLDETREIHIYHPPDTTKPYPTIYLLDGHSLHNITASTIQHYADRDRSPQTILIGITSTDRLRDFTPTPRKSYDGTYGGGKAHHFLEFLETELIPKVEQKYNTKNYRTLIGHSYGGLFTTYTLTARPDLFNAYLASSPWLNQDDTKLTKQIQKQLQTGYNNKKQLYIAHEPITSPGIEDRIKELKTTLQQNPHKTLDWHYKKYKDADHSNLPLKAIPDALDFFFPGYLQT